MARDSTLTREKQITLPSALTAMDGEKAGTSTQSSPVNDDINKQILEVRSSFNPQHGYHKTTNDHLPHFPFSASKGARATKAKAVVCIPRTEPTDGSAAQAANWTQIAGGSPTQNFSDFVSPRKFSRHDPRHTCLLWKHEHGTCISIRPCDLFLSFESKSREKKGGKAQWAPVLIGWRQHVASEA